MLNKAIIIGRVVEDPKVIAGQYGEFVTFSVATYEKGFTTGDGTEVPGKMEWHNIFCHGKNVERVKGNITEGTLVYIEGKLRTQQYEKHDGTKCSVMKIYMEDFDLLESKKAREKRKRKPKQDEEAKATKTRGRKKKES